MQPPYWRLGSDFTTLAQPGRGQGVYYRSNALAWIHHFIFVIKVGCISLVIYRTSSSWNCLKLGAKQLLPGQAVRSVNHSTIHTCQPTSSSSPCILMMRNSSTCLIKIDILLFTTLNFMILLIPFLSFEGPEKTGEASTVFTISFERHAPSVKIKE